MKRFFCEKCNGMLPKWDSTCDKCGYFNEALYPEIENGRKRRKVIVAFSIIAIISAIVLLSVWDIFIDPPAFWHFRQADKQAIVQYQRQHYPGAKVIERNFPFLGNPHLVGAPVESSMTFEYDGVKFGIAAWDGKLNYDYFPYARATSQIENIIDEFIELRGLEVAPHL